MDRSIAGVVFGGLLLASGANAAPGDGAVNCGIQDHQHLGQIIALATCEGSSPYSQADFVTDYYSKWKVELVDSDPKMFFRDYESEKPNILSRLLSGKTRSLIVSLKMRLTNPSVEYTIPLVAVSYDGKVGKGESFVTTLTESNIDQPYFRITATTQTALTLSASYTANTDTQIAAMSLSTFQSALKLAAPQTSLLTELNKDSSTRIANALDSTLGGMMSDSRTETITATRLSNIWDPGSYFMVALHLPGEVELRSGPKPAPGQEDQGRVTQAELRFKISLVCPRASVFASVSCPPEGPVPSQTKTMIEIRERLSEQEVLSFELAPGQTIKDRIVSREFVLNFLRRLEDVAAKDDTLAMASFCDAVLGDFRAVGLSTLDAKIATWAVIAGVGDLAAIRPLAENVPACSAVRPSKEWLYTRSL